MYCPNCGRKTSEEARFCANCGTKFSQPDVPLQPVPVRLVGEEPGLPPVPVRLSDEAADLPPVPVQLVDGSDLPPVPVHLVDGPCLPPVPVQLVEPAPVPVKLADEQPITKAPAAPQAEAESVEDLQEAIRPPEINVFRIRFAWRNGQSILEVQAPGSPQPLAAPFQVPYDASSRFALLEHLQKGSQPTSDVLKLQQDTGARLLHSLLPNDAIRNTLNQAAGQAAAMQRPLILQMRFDSNAVEQAQLPWELLYNGTKHLALSEEIHLNRYVTYFGDRQPFPSVQAVRVLFVIARPTDQADLPLYERDAMINALQNLAALGKVQITILEQATFANFATTVQSGTYQVIHFDGHGGFENEGFLCFENSTGTTDPVPASRLAQVLQNSGVRLVVLSACMSATVGGNSVFNSAAPALIRARVPAVVAHQFSVPFSASLAFVKAFYASIGRGESISSAVADGRKAIVLDDQAQAVWFYPVLYLRSASGDGYLFSDSPADQMQWMLNDLAQMSEDWTGMPLEEQNLYPEGVPLWQGEEINLQNYLDVLDEELSPSLPQSVNIPEIGEMLLIPRGEFLLGSTGDEIAQLEAQLPDCGNQFLEKLRAQNSQQPGVTPQILQQSVDGYRQHVEKDIKEMRELLRQETPQQKAFLRSYYIARRPLNFRQWWEFVKDNGYHRQEFWRPAAWQELQHGDPAQQQMYQQMAAMDGPLKYLNSFGPLGYHSSFANEQINWKYRKAYAQEMITKCKSTPAVGNANEWRAYLQGLEEIQQGITDPATGRLLCPWLRWFYWIAPYWAGFPKSFFQSNDEKPAPSRFPGYPNMLIMFGVDMEKGADPKVLPTLQRCLDLNPTVPLDYAEANAFCKWASQKSIERHGIHAAYYTLAYEAEWEKAARGTDGRVYPWGNEFDEELASAQGGYAAGASPYGVEGMCSGSPENVIHVSNGGIPPDHARCSAEWTASLKKPYPLGDFYEDNPVDPAQRVIRGNDREWQFLRGTHPITNRCAGVREAWSAKWFPARVRIVSRSTGALSKIIPEENDKPQDSP
jgi:formylglycine-generating enzyme required for sulfatase activity